MHRLLVPAQVQKRVTYLANLFSRTFCITHSPLVSIIIVLDETPFWLHVLYLVQYFPIEAINRYRRTDVGRVQSMHRDIHRKAVKTYQDIIAFCFFEALSYSRTRLWAMSLSCSLPLCSWFLPPRPRRISFSFLIMMLAMVVGQIDPLEL